MNEHISNEAFKNRILELIKTDENFRLTLIGALSSGFMTKTEYQQLLNELKQQRKIMTKEFREARKERRKIWEEIAGIKQENQKIWEEIAGIKQENQKIWEEIAGIKQEIKKIWEKIADIEEEIRKLREETKKIWEEIAKMREDYNKQFERVDRRFKKLEDLISALGGRWGVNTEKAFRNALIDLAKEAVGAEVKRLKMYDEKGIVYGEPGEVEVDIAVRNEQHILIEIKARVRKSDVAELLRIGELYEKKYHVKPMLMFVTPLVDKNAYDFAIKKNIKIYNYLEESQQV